MRHRKFLRLSLGWRILAGLIIGILLGVVFYQNKTFIGVAQGTGTIFINMISMIVLPIVVSSLTVGIANMGDLHKLGRIGGKTLIYFEIMSTVALALGLLMANLTHVGTLVDLHSLQATDISQYVASAKEASHHGIGDILMTIVPTNIFAALSAGNMLPIIFFAVFFGLGVAAIGERGQIIIDFLQAVAETMFKVTSWVMQLAPFGVAGLIGVTVAQLGLNSLKPLGLFILVAYATMAIFIIGIMGIVAKIFGFNIFDNLLVIKDELILAFTTASSEATLPRLIEKTQKLGVSKGVVSFVIPTGYTFNLDGSAIYQALAALFLAQAYHIHLSLGQQITLLVVLMVTSKGMAGVPGASFVVLLATISTIGVPASGLALIAGIDRLVDMGRTAVNVAGNSLATMVIGKSEGEFDMAQHDAYVASFKKQK
ncbi:cation:dicarboxylase symporter family transporter [Periweissella cryptocerci]|uniref:Cation:dicarboxylase symporter family transporter n=1 Tax=Periweissella cryptocerci TaxID=2506420 RepID=A0A4P6YVP0_9LACO|nr:cation:dicarboxylase symporter family transporter [Periweissella cryptocerci]QBO36868.1 cation:dicarboxylase symporter family transporter [Periweissella cryptocerci]